MDITASERAVQLLRGYLSPEQLASLDKPRCVPDGWGSAHNYDWFRWFNVVGSLGGLYTVAGFCGVHTCGTFVGAGHDSPRNEWCVHVFGPPIFPGHRRCHMPVGDQMLAFKLVLENEEATFLYRACPTSDTASRMTRRQYAAVTHAAEGNLQ